MEGVTLTKNEYQCFFVRLLFFKIWFVFAINIYKYDINQNKYFNGHTFKKKEFSSGEEASLSLKLLSNYDELLSSKVI